MSQPTKRTFLQRFLQLGLVLAVVYVLVAYVILPLFWRTTHRSHPDLSGEPRLTRTASDIPGDPINIGLVGSEDDLVRQMTAAKWFPADPITFRSSLRIIADTLLKRPDDEAPVSNLFLFGRKQDLAFEQPIGDSPRQRHPVRFWRSDSTDEGRPLWLGSATLDVRVGLSRTTLEVTHHIGPDVDAERDRIASELGNAGGAQEVYWVDGFHQQLQGKNGGGDPWHTDGRPEVVVLPPTAVASPRTNSQ